MDDKRFFRNNLNRRHRVRYATNEEIEQLQITGKLPRGDRLYVIVRQINCGYFARQFVLNSKDAGVDVDELFADVLFDMAADGWL